MFGHERKERAMYGMQLAIGKVASEKEILRIYTKASRCWRYPSLGFPPRANGIHPGKAHGKLLDIW